MVRALALEAAAFESLFENCMAAPRTLWSPRPASLGRVGLGAFVVAMSWGARLARRQARFASLAPWMVAWAVLKWFRLL